VSSSLDVSSLVAIDVHAERNKNEAQDPITAEILLRG
jgi:hypothetical protein